MIASRYLVLILGLLTLHAPIARAGEPADAPAATFSSTDRLVGTYYFYWYKYPTEHFFDKPGDDALTDHFPHPEKVDYESVEWHMGELSDMASCGIDFVLPVYWGAPGAYDVPGIRFSTRGLDALAAARSRLFLEGRPAPRIGMFYDTSSLLNRVRRVEPLKAKPDLTRPEGKNLFSGTINDYFERLDRRHWAILEGQPIVALYTSAFAERFDRSTFQYASESFRRDFGVRPYIIAENSWRSAKGADAYYRWGAALNGPYILDVAAVGPGYDDRAVPGRKTPIREREDGAFYKLSWQKAIASGRKIVLIETWNEMHEGTDICESREHGRKYIDLTREFAQAFKQGRSIPGTIALKHENPKPLPPSTAGGEFAKEPAVSIDFAAQAEKGLRILRNEDGQYEMITVEGRRCARSLPGAPNAYLYFAVPDPWFFDAREPIEIEIEYLDRGHGPIRLQYDSRDERLDHAGAYKAGGVAKRTATNQWRTHRFALRDAALTNRQNRGADFRLAVTSESLCVSRVEVRKAPNRNGR